jgi:hypothetical protein
VYKRIFKNLFSVNLKIFSKKDGKVDLMLENLLVVRKIESYVGGQTETHTDTRTHIFIMLSV